MQKCGAAISKLVVSVPSSGDISTSNCDSNLFSVDSYNQQSNPSINLYANNTCNHSFSNGVDENRPYCRALYDFKGEFENELTFCAGEIIYIQQRVNNTWLEGECQSSGLCGIFPACFVEVVVDLALENDYSNDKNSTFNASGVALVVQDFVARFNDELSVNNGESVKVIEIVDENWAKCQNLTNGSCGIVPQNFLQIFLENDDIYNSSTSPGPKEAVKYDSTESSITSEVPWDLSLRPELLADASKSVPDTSFQSSSLQPIELFTSSSQLHPSLPDVALSSNTQKTPPKQPPRPPPPKNVPRKLSKDADKSGELVTFVSSAKSSHVSCLPTNFQDQKSKIAQDLLLTETTYLFDLDAWQTCILASTELNEENKRILNNGLPLLKELSQKLIDSIKLEREKAADEQYFGQMFMMLKERFFHTFSHHCRCVEEISQILENNVDSKVQDALNNCVSKLREMGSNVFDVPTAVSRPIQRCLKYPLYVGELLKNTPLNHKDHPKLMESLKQLGNLASKMNECKRRKELIRKYREEQQLSFSERLSRINLHSLVKKSNRLKYRISSTMGFNIIRDNEFDYLISLLDSSERRVCKFLYCTQLYKKNMEIAFKKYEDNFKGNSPLQDEKALKTMSGFINKIDVVKRDFLQNLENLIINEGKKLVRCEYTKLIHKRCDKLADYETAKVTNKNGSEVEMRRNEYEALNNQVKNGLPKLISTINKEVTELVKKIHELDCQLITQLNAITLAYSHDFKDNVLFRESRLFGDYVSAVFPNRFVEIDKVLRLKTAVEQQQNSMNNKNNSRSTSLRLNESSKSKHILSSSHASFKNSTDLTRLQTRKERDAVIKIMKAQEGGIDNLRLVCASYSTSKLQVNTNDVVIVKGHKDGMCLCDNGVSIDYIPIGYLRLFDDITNDGIMQQQPLVDILSNPELRTEQSFRPFSLPSFDSIYHSSNGKKPSKNFENNLIDLSNTDKQKANILDDLLFIQYDKEPSRTGNVQAKFDNKSFMSKSSVNNFEKDDLFADLFHAAIAMPSKKTQYEQDTLTKKLDKSCSSSEPPIIPIRTAPLPPLPAPVAQTHNSEQTEKKENVMKCGYDFLPIISTHSNSNCQIAVREGELVAVLQRQDDAGNSEWWLVQHLSEGGKIGYVPAAYLLPV